MAEQISHHVVNESQSAGSSLPVDAAANQTIQVSAGNGPSDQPLSADAKTTNELANDANAALTSNVSATDAAAGPSAGSAADGLAAAPVIVTETDKSSEARPPLMNGTSTSGENAADDVSVQGSADLSLHSDTEGSKGDGAEQKGDDKHHVRKESVKKPATFSKVSVTKNFLAKSATPTPTTAKLGEKPSPAGTPTAASSVLKPRLIAKSGSTLQNLQKSRLGSEGAAGPDASKVWNKNRPVPPPPPKQFTDEELKQQFGIHMTARLQSDEDGKDAKWADIDDEEEDWAPEAVVWMDGTKSTLTAQEAAAAPPELKQPAAQIPNPAEGTRPKLALQKRTELGPQKTILKPGAGAAAVQALQNGLGAGAPTDKPSLKAKSPASTPSKSPWAVLPPVERVSPINPPVQQTQPPPQQPFMSQDARAYESAPPPAREMRADTFERSWRDGEGAPRELYNAANGRYEPAPEGRRASKPDAGYRKPAVLQRPSYGAGPAEPSAAFQSRTSVQMDGSGPRRRGSSSVSQGSMPPPRRMSMSKPQEGERRPSMVIGHDMRASPNMARNEPTQPPQFAQQSAWQQQMPPQPEGDAEVLEDPVKKQEKVMREKRELAKKRREEEEAKAEAEKQERLAARLAALGGAGKSRKEREAEALAAAAASAQTTPATELPNQPHYIAPTSGQAQPAKPTETATIAGPALEAQTLPPAPSPAKSQQPQQPSPEEKLPSPLPAKPSSGLPDRPVSSTDQSQRQPARAHLSPRANARAPFQQQPGPYRAPTSSYSSPGDRKQQPFGRSPFASNDTLSSAWPTTAPNSNVWGTSLGGIGNGTFESASTFAPMPMSQQNSSLPPPPGMGPITRPSTSTRISPQGLGQESRSPSLQQQSVAEPTHRGFAPPGLESRPDPFAQQARANGASPAPGLGRQAHLPGPIAPPSRAQSQQQAQSTSRPDPLSAWNNAAQRLPHEYKNQTTAATEIKKEAVAPREDTIKETFKKTTGAVGRLGGPRKYDTTEYTVHDGAGSRALSGENPAPPSTQTQPAGPFSTASPLPPHLRGTTAENTVRIPDGSLNPAHGGAMTQQPPIGPPSQQRAAPSAARAPNYPTGPLPPAPATFDQSPPPPEEGNHPVYSGDHSHPLVKLPSAQPKPVVRLPPAPAQQTVPQQPNQVSMPHRPISTWGAPPGSKPLVMQEAWQARFNGLFARTPIHTETPPSPPKTPPKMQVPAAAVTSSTRATMSEMPAATNAIVSLPQNVPSSPKANKTIEGFLIDDSKDATSKPVIEDMFKEEQSFGSLPKVTVPKNPTYHPRVHEPLTRNLLHMGSNSKFFKATETQSVQELNLREVHPVKGAGVYISLPQIKDRNGNRLSKLVFHPNRGQRQPSGRINNKNGPPPRANNANNANHGKDATPPSGPSSQSESRKTSFQAQNTQSPAPAAAGSPASKRGGAWARPSRGQHNNNNSHSRRPVPATPS